MLSKRIFLAFFFILSLLMNLLNHPNSFLTLSVFLIHTQTHSVPSSPSPWNLYISVSDFHPPVQFFRWAFSSHSAVSVLWGGFMYPFSNNQQLNNAVSTPCQLPYCRQHHIRHMQGSIRTHIHTSFFTWQHNPAMLLSVIYETQLKGCEGSLLAPPNSLAFFISARSLCVCVCVMVGWGCFYSMWGAGWGKWLGSPCDF